MAFGDRKRCAGPCGEIKPLANFGKNSSSSDGHKSYCADCTNQLGARRRKLNIAGRLKHHFATRIKKQLQLCECTIPENLTEHLERYLGYPMWKLRKYLDLEIKHREGISLRQALDRDYHVDHIQPMSSFDVKECGDLTFRQCWALKNLRAIPAEENLAKGASIIDDVVDNIDIVMYAPSTEESQRMIEEDEEQALGGDSAHG